VRCAAGPAPSSSDRIWRLKPVTATMEPEVHTKLGDLIMIRELEENLQAVTEACRRFGVVRLYVFGSSLRDDFRLGASDIDLLVEFQPDESYALVDAYFGLLDELRDLLGNVDLVMA